MIVRMARADDLRRPLVGDKYCELGRLMRITACGLLVGPIGARNEYRINASSISNAATIQQAARDD
jgi:hypothetical protein